MLGLLVADLSDLVHWSDYWEPGLHWAPLQYTLQCNYLQLLLHTVHHCTNTGAQYGGLHCTGNISGIAECTEGLLLLLNVHAGMRSMHCNKAPFCNLDFRTFHHERIRISQDIFSLQDTTPNPFPGTCTLPPPRILYFPSPMLLYSALYCPPQEYVWNGLLTAVQEGRGMPAPNTGAK